jgi:transporter family protein
MPTDSWIALSLLSAFLMAVVNIIDKFILTKWVKNPMLLVVFFGIIGLIPSLTIFGIRGLPRLSGFNIFLAFLAGGAYLLMSFFYFRAAQLEEISRVVPLFYLAPFFVSIFAFLFLGEFFSSKQYAGIAFLIAGAMLISAKKSSQFHGGKAVWLMTLAALSYSIMLVLSKHLLNHADFWTVFALIRTGMFLALVPSFCILARNLLRSFKEQGLKIIGFIALNEALALVGSFVLTIAASLGAVTLVNALSTVQPFFVLLFASLLSLFFPKVIKEDVGKKALITKFIAILLMVTGALLIS